MKKTVSTSGRELVVVVGELELGLEVGDRAQAADEEPGPDRAAEVDGQAVEASGPRPGPPSAGSGGERGAG